MGKNGFCVGVELKRQRVFQLRRFPRRVEQKRFRTAGVVRTAGIVGKLGSAEHFAGAEIGQLLHEQIQTDRDSTFQKSGVFYTESSCKAVNNRLMSVASVPLVTTCQSKSIITLESCRISLSCLKEII